MNYLSICAQLIEQPREVYISSTSTVARCKALLPGVSSKAPTPIELNFYGKASEKFLRLPINSCIYIEGATLRHDLQARQLSSHGGTFGVVTDQFPILNTVILTGRCIKDINRDEERAFKTTANGLMICNQTLSVSTGKGQADLFNFFAINKVDDKVNYAELLVNFTRKGTGLTIKGKLITDEWTDQTTKERKHLTKIQINKMTLAPRQEGTGTIAPQASLPADTAPATLWGGRTAEDVAEPWGINTGSDLAHSMAVNNNNSIASDDEPPF